MISPLSMQGWLILNGKSSSSLRSGKSCKNPGQRLPFQTLSLQNKRLQFSEICFVAARIFLPIAGM